MKKAILLLLIFVLPSGLLAQYRSQTKPVSLVSLLNAPAQLGRSAASMLGLDVSRLRIYQSYQMSFMSMGGQGISQGVYLNTMVYDFKFPLQVAVQWGISHQPFASSDNAPFLKNGPFISGAQILYQPSKNLLFQLNYSQVPNRYSPYGYYSNPAMRGW